MKRELIAKSREAALAAIKVFNDPLIKFKSETFIVLMTIAWTYLLHAYFRSKGVEYRYYDQGRKRRVFHKTTYGAHKRWELRRCLDDKNCPIDRDAANNLRFLTTLRDEISHQMTLSLDSYLSGRYQACVMNYNRYVKELFGDRHGLDSYLGYSLQFLELSAGQVLGHQPETDIPDRLRAFIAEFDHGLTEAEYNSPFYSYRLVFTRKLVNRPGQADRVVEFIDPDSELAKTMDKQYVVKKEVERQKYRPTDVAAAVQERGFRKFRVNPEHLSMWRSEDAKNPSKGYGVDVRRTWYWYESWVNRCIQLCEAEGQKYR